MDTITRTVEKVHCDCEDWTKGMKTIQYALETYDALGFDSGMKRFDFCPYCGTKLHVTSTSNARREFPAASAGKLDGVVGGLDSEI